MAIKSIEMKEKNLSYLYVILAVTLWASVAGVGKLVLQNLNNIQVLLYTSIIATISLCFIALWQKKLQEVKSYELKDYWFFLYMGFIGVFLYYVFLFGAFMLAPAQEAFIVNYTWPIWVVIFAIAILKESFNAKKAISIILGFIGVYIVVTRGNLLGFEVGSIKGNLLALGGAISYGLFSILGKRHDKYDKTVSMMFYCGFSFIFTLIAVLMFSEIPIVTLSEFIGLLWLGTFSNGLGFLFWFLALKHGDTSQMSNIVFATPFLSLVYIYFLTGEEIVVSSVIGLLIIVIGIVIQSIKK